MSFSKRSEQSGRSPLLFSARFYPHSQAEQGQSGSSGQAGAENDVDGSASSNDECEVDSAEEVDYDAEFEGVDGDGMDFDDHVQGQLSLGKQRKLWSRVQFPEGTTGHKNWDLANLSAAQDWTCPCPDRRNCIGSERLHNILDLYEHRKQFRSTAHTRGGYRDACRQDLQQRYEIATKSFIRAFKVLFCVRMTTCEQHSEPECVGLLVGWSAR